MAFSFIISVASAVVAILIAIHLISHLGEIKHIPAYNRGKILPWYGGGSAIIIVCVVISIATWPF